MIKTLAIARLTMLITDDEVSAPLRDAAIRLDDRFHNAFTDKLLYFVTCRRCVSVWAAAAVLLADRVPGGRFAVQALAGSQAALIALALNERIER